VDYTQAKLNTNNSDEVLKGCYLFSGAVEKLVVNLGRKKKEDISVMSVTALPSVPALVCLWHSSQFSRLCNHVCEMRREAVASPVLVYTVLMLPRN